MDFIQMATVLVLVLLLAMPMGRYIAAAFSLEENRVDRIFGGTRFQESGHRIWTGSNTAKRCLPVTW